MKDVDKNLTRAVEIRNASQRRKARSRSLERGFRPDDLAKWKRTRKHRERRFESLCKVLDAYEAGDVEEGGYLRKELVRLYSRFTDSEIASHEDPLWLMAEQEVTDRGLTELLPDDSKIDE